MKFQVEEAIEILAATPSVIAALLGGLSDQWTASAGDRDDWTPYDIVGHYIHAEETDWIPRARVILDRDGDHTFAPFDRFAQFDNSGGRGLNELIADFAVRRTQSLETLKSWNLSEEQLALTGFHPELGEVTLGNLLSTWVVHDLTHIRQIVSNLARKYGDNVGVWKEYLSILK